MQHFLQLTENEYQKLIELLKTVHNNTTFSNQLIIETILTYIKKEIKTAQDEEVFLKLAKTNDDKCEGCYFENKKCPKKEFCCVNNIFVKIKGG
jgi:hypothetical protein